MFTKVDIELDNNESTRYLYNKVTTQLYPGEPEYWWPVWFIRIRNGSCDTQPREDLLNTRKGTQNLWISDFEIKENVKFK